MQTVEGGKSYSNIEFQKVSSSKNTASDSRGSPWYRSSKTKSVKLSSADVESGGGIVQKFQIVSLSVREGGRLLFEVQLVQMVLSKLTSGG